MSGLIKKDLLIIKNNIKALIILIILDILFSFTNDADLSFIIPFLVITIFISTFSYDDFNNWNAYAITLPNKRQKIVQAKYLSAIITSISVALFSTSLSIIISLIKGNTRILNILSSSCGSLLAIIILISLLIPFIFKYGSEKGRIIIFSLIFGIAGFIAILSKTNKVKIPANILTFLTNHGEILIIIISLITLIISYLISQKIYSRKDF